MPKIPPIPTDFPLRPRAATRQDICGANWGHSGAIFGYQGQAYWNARTGRTVVIASTMFPAPAAAESPLATATDLALCANAKAR